MQCYKVAVSWCNTAFYTVYLLHLHSGTVVVLQSCNTIVFATILLIFMVLVCLGLSVSCCTVSSISVAWCCSVEMLCGSWVGIVIFHFAGLQCHGVAVPFIQCHFIYLHSVTLL
jgi:hypothetical protein